MQTSKQYRRFSHVHLNDFANCADFDLDRRVAHLGPQPQLGLWSERRFGIDCGYSACAAVDGPNLVFNSYLITKFCY